MRQQRLRRGSLDLIVPGDGGRFSRGGRIPSHRTPFFPPAAAASQRTVPHRRSRLFHREPGCLCECSSAAPEWHAAGATGVRVWSDGNASWVQLPPTESIWCPALQSVRVCMTSLHEQNSANRHWHAIPTLMTGWHRFQCCHQLRKGEPPRLPARHGMVTMGADSRLDGVRERESRSLVLPLQ